MKRLIVYLEGLLTPPVPALRDRTALATARMPHLSALAESGAAGCILSGRGQGPASPQDLWAHLCGIQGATGSGGPVARGPLEQLIVDGADAAAFPQAWRASLVSDEGNLVRELVPSPSLEETRLLGDHLTAAGIPAGGRLHPLEPGEFLLELPDQEPPSAAESEDAGTCPGWPREHPQMPRWFGRRPSWFAPFTQWSREALAGHPVNEVRIDLGENPAHRLWLWGGGRQPGALTPTAPLAVFGHAPLSAGWARACGGRHYPLRHPLDREGRGPVFRVPDAVEALRRCEVVLIHVAAPGFAGHYANAETVIRVLERLDTQLFGPLREILAAYRPFQATLIAADALRPAEEVRLSGRLPVLQWGEGIEADAGTAWTEDACDAGGLGEIPVDDLHRVVWS